MGRLTFLDGLRGVALILMVLNHTSRDWMTSEMGWGRYYLVYGSLILPAPIFLFLVGFCLPIPFHRRPVEEPLGARAARYFRRGIGIVAGGYLLNLITSDFVFTMSSTTDGWAGRLLDVALSAKPPLWSGGVLQTIGLAVILLGPTVPLFRRRGTVAVFGALAVLSYLSFLYALPALTHWTTAHPQLSRAFFNDFPPWPWLGPAIVGLVAGWLWLEARAQGPEPERRFFTVIAWIGFVCVLAYLAWEWFVPTTPRFGFPRDFSVNRHWTPRGATLWLVAAGVALLLSGLYWLMERRKVSLPWLVTLGQTALMLYFVHQFIELTLVNKVLGIRFTSWWLYWLANAVFVVLLVWLGRTWQEMKPRLPGQRARPKPAAPLRAA
jgi:peptidoglycan/LPS O-acetylase OafA/YrhL